MINITKVGKIPVYPLYCVVCSTEFETNEITCFRLSPSIEVGAKCPECEMPVLIASIGVYGIRKEDDKDTSGNTE